jgi:CRP-like cAMP-binding protein
MRQRSRAENAAAERPASPSQRSHAREVMAAVPWFFHCKPATLDRFVAQGRIRAFSLDEAICRQGEKVQAMIVILSGTVEISSVAPSGKRHVLTHLRSGGLFNLVPLLDDGPAIYDSRAHQPTSTLLVPGTVVLAALDEEPALARDLMHLLSFRTRKLSGYISDEALMPLPTRCARLFLSLIEYHGVRQGDGFLIDLKLSQEELAEMLGRTRQSVNQEIRTLEEAGIIETAYSRFVVRDVEALKALAEEY